MTKRAPGVVLCVLAAGLTVVGAFLPLFTSTIRLGHPNSLLAVTITGWGVRATANGLPDTPPTNVGVADNGVPLVLAALLLVGVVVVHRFTVAASAFLAGVVLTVGLQEFAWRETFRPTGIIATVPDLAVRLTVGSGFWLLAAAVVLAAAASVLTMWPARVVEREEPETPRLGIPVVVRLPDEPPDRD
jgi:hypothetical protein